MNCSACGNELPINAKFCGNCGQAAATVELKPEKPTTEPVIQAFGGSPTAITNPPAPSGPIIQQQSNMSSLARFLLFAILIALVGGGIWAYSNGYLSDDKNKNLTSREDLPISNGTTNCFTLALPLKSDARTLDECRLTIYYGPEAGFSRIETRTLNGGASNLQGLTAEWKTQAKRYSDVIVSETATKVGTYNAHKIIYQFQDSGQTYISVLVHTGQKYKTSSSAIDGFEITGSYGTTNDQKQTFDAVLASLQWK